jgi:glycosyltransferase involved in cell wall biosynthesis
LPVEFHLVGSLEDEIPGDVKQHVHLYGIIKDAGKLAQLHQRMHVLLMTSALEGFPLSIMEAMAHGSVPMVTAVNAIPEHVHHGENGFLLQQPQDEAGVVAQAISLIENFCVNPALLQPFSLNAYQYAVEHFSASAFHQKMADALFPGTGQ